MRRRWVLPAAAAALALVTTVAIVGYLQNLQQRATVPAPVRTEAVVFARANIAQRKVVRGEFLELRQVPVAAIHPQAARQVEDVVNRVAVAPLYADEQVLLSKLAPTGVNAGLSYVLPKDKRAMTIAVNEVIGVAGFVFPGDRVDVVSTVRVKDESFTKVVLQDVEVLAIAQKVEQKPGEEPRVTTSATLALTPDQAEVLAEVDNSGKVRLALRPYGMTQRVQTAGTTVAGALGQRAVPQASARKAAGPGPVTRARDARKPAPAARVAATAPRGPEVYLVELYRATEKSVVRFEEARR